MPTSKSTDQVASDPAANSTFRQAAEQAPLNLDMALELVLCGVLLAGLSLLAQHLHPELSRPTLFSGLGGGGLCVLWGVLARRTTRYRAGGAGDVDGGGVRVRAPGSGILASAHRG